MTHAPTDAKFPPYKLAAVTGLIPYARNARTHSDAQVAQIAASIREFGFTNPVLVDAEGGVIAGHGRLLAARKLGMAEVPTLELSHLSPAQRRAYVLADNRLALSAGWDEDLLRIELGGLQADGFDLALTGFDLDEITSFLAEPTAGLTDPDDVPAAPELPVSRTGDVWLLGRHRLLCGDSTDPATVERALAGVRPHLMVTDPPYGVDYDPAWRNRAGLGMTQRVGRVENDDRADWREAWALFPGDVAYVWHGALHATTVAASLDACGFQIRAQVIWAKDRRPQADHAMADREPGSGRRDGARDAEAGRVHAPADGEQQQPGPGGLRAVQRVGHDVDRCRAGGAGVPRDRAVAGLRRRGGAALAGVHRAGGGAGGEGDKLRGDGIGAPGGDGAMTQGVRFEPTDEQRRIIKAMSGFGVPQDDIALLLDIDPKTLRKHLQAELDRGSIEATAKVGQSLFRMATEGNNVAAAIFWMKARAGWREKHEVKVIEDDLSLLTDEELEQRADDLERQLERGKYAKTAWDNRLIEGQVEEPDETG